MDKILNGTVSQRTAGLKELLHAKNYSSKTLNLAAFDPCAFSLEDTRAAVRAALRSKASVRAGAKVFKIPLSPEALEKSGGGASGFAKPRKGQRLVHELDDSPSAFPGFTSEIVSDRRDNTRNALCALCGTPHQLKACAKCRNVWYCGREHQRLEFLSCEIFDVGC